MTKADLVQEISKQTGIDRDEVLMIVLCNRVRLERFRKSQSSKH